MIIEFRKPDIGFNPVTVATLKIVENSQVRLKPIKRYVTINETDSVINFYVELTDGNIVLTLPVKYYMWVAMEFTNTVVCAYTKFRDGDNSYSCVEVIELDKVNIQLTSDKIDVFKEDGNKIPESYTRLREEECLVKTMLNSYNRGLAFGMGTGYIENNKVYVRAICSIENLLNREKNFKLNYRELELNGKAYKVDIEVVPHSS